MNSSVRPRLDLVLLCTVLAAAVVVLFLLLGPALQVQSLLNDDAYYYFKIVRNLLDGHGVSFDGLHPTNGFHPLYFALLVPLFAVAGRDPILPLRLALVMLAVFYFATALPIRATARRLAGERAGGAAALAWTFGPLFLFFARGGLEVAVYAFFLATLAACYVTRFREEPTPARAAGLGLLAGLTLLARTDGLLFLGAIGLDFLLLRARWLRGPGHALGLLLAAVLPLALVVSPWVIWNLATFGSVVQGSAVAHTFQARGGKTIANAFASLLRRTHGPRIAVALAAAAGLAALAAAAAWSLRRTLAASLGRAAFLVFYLALFAGVVFGVYHWYRNWYFLAPAAATVMLLATVLLAEPTAGAPARRAGPLLFGALWLGSAAAGTLQFAELRSPASRECAPCILQDLDWVAANLPRDAVIGAFNAGHDGWYLPQRVINLDGLVNNEIVPRFRARTLDAYLEERGIDYVLDQPGYISFYFDTYAQGWEKSLVFERQLRWWQLYRVRRS